MSLVAMRDIIRGKPIRATYGWIYWFQPRLFTAQLMQKAFDGYLNDIARDEDAANAWAYAELIGRTEHLQTAWATLHRHVSIPPFSMPGTPAKLPPHQ